LVFITEMKSVYSAVRTGSLNKAVCVSSVKGLKGQTCESLGPSNTNLEVHKGKEVILYKF